MQLKYFLVALLIGSLAINYTNAIYNEKRMRDADDDRRRSMCARFDMTDQNKMREMKECAFCCYDDNRHIDDLLSKETKTCICTTTGELDYDENEALEVLDIEDEADQTQQIDPEH